MSELVIAIGAPSKVKEYNGPLGIAFKEIIPKRPEGRPTVMTPDVIQKLEDAFMHAFTDKEACLYAGISPATLYKYCDEHPEFSERKETLKLSPNLVAKKELVDGIKGNMDQSRWWAVHQIDEFAPKSKVQHSGAVTTAPVPMTPEVEKVVQKFNDEMRKAIAAPHMKPKQP